jgi:hypothetical protein
MRHGTSAIVLTIAGTLSLGFTLVIAAVVFTLAYGVASGVTGWDPAGLGDGAAHSSAGSASSACDSNYEGACLDPDASDYDCEGGSGDGPEYTGIVTVVGTDAYGLDRDGDGTGCD